MKTKGIKYISYHQAALMLGVAVITIKKWAKSGVIKRYAVTKRSVFVDREEILALIKKKEVSK